MDDEQMDDQAQLVCADCGAEGPEYAIVNRFVMVCSECCSIHRSLGRHISQVKSLKKGAWNSNQLVLVNLLYRNGSNNIWEHSLVDISSGQYLSSKSKKKPVSNDPIIPKKEAFIKAKYVQLNYAVRPPKDSNLDDLNKQLWCCVRTSHVETTLRLLALGADPNYVDSDKGNAPLHIAAKDDQSLQVELLYIYGADPAQRNFDGVLPAQMARAEKHFELADRIDELEFEVTDRFSMFLCGRLPDHKRNQHFLIPELAGQASSQIRQFCQMLQTCSNHIFERLVQDVYDEVDRRDVAIQWISAEHFRIGGHQHVAMFLPPCQTLSATRNQMRQKLAKFDTKEFSQLLIDLLKECRRRHFGLPLPPEEKKSPGLNESVLDDSREYDEVADTSVYRKSRSSNSTKHSSELANHKAVGEISDENPALINASLALDNYLELKERFIENAEKLDSVLQTNAQLLKGFHFLQEAVERIQMDQSELRRQVNAISNVKNSLTRVASPTPMLSRASPIPLLATSEIGAVILPTSSLLASSSSNPSFAASDGIEKTSIGNGGARSLQRKNSSFMSPTHATANQFDTSCGSMSKLMSSGVSKGNTESTRNGLPVSPPVWHLSERQLPSHSELVGSSNTVGSGSLGGGGPVDRPRNTPTLKALFNDEVFPDNLILETELLTVAIKSLLSDLQQQGGSSDCNAVFHADSIRHHISRILRAIPTSHLVGEVQLCVGEMEVAMNELSRRCLSQPLNTDETCHAAYDVAKAAKQLLVTVHNRGDF